MKIVFKKKIFKLYFFIILFYIYKLIFKFWKKFNYSCSIEIYKSSKFLKYLLF